jgi:hypothetical protein
LNNETKTSKTERMQSSFEKRVQEKLEELKLTPSEPVWKNIEKEIKPARRRRFPFWIPFVIMLTGTAWWLLAKNDQAPAQETGSVSAQTSAESEKENAKHTTTTLPAEKNGPATDPAQKATTPVERYGDEDIPAGTIALQTNKTLPAGTTGRYTTDRAKLSGRNAVTNRQSQQSIPTLPERAEKETSFQHEQAGTGNIPPASGAKNSEVAPALSAIDSTVAVPAPADSSVKPIDKKEGNPLKANDSAAVKTKIAGVQKGWRKTITLEGGWSQASTGGLFGGSGRVPQYFASPSTGYGNGVNFGLPTGTRSGTAFRFGVGLSKALSNRWEFAVGLQYAQYSTRTRVGEFRSIDTAVASSNRNVALEGYFRNTNQQDYTNRYHMLELPVSVGFRPLARLPLQLSVGVLYGRLLNTNALAFNPWGNIYYKDEQAIQKNAFAGFTSLQFTVLKNAGWQLDVGPVVQYQFSPLKKDSVQAQHLSFAGLKTTFRF